MIDSNTIKENITKREYNKTQTILLFRGEYIG